MNWLYLNQEFMKEGEASLHISDLALQRGYGVFDYLKVIDGKPLFLEAHLKRLFHSATAMRLTLRQSITELSSIISTLIEKNNAGTSGIRITVTGGYSPNGYSIAAPNLFIQQQPLKLPDQNDFEKGIRLVSYPHIRPLSHVKSINYLMGIWLQEYVIQQMADEVLYHWDGMVSECPRANLFIVTQDNVIVTPKNGILKGITRQLILEEITGIRCEQRDISLEEIYNSREVFITSTTKQILPVQMVDGRKIHDGKSGPISWNILQHLLRLPATVCPGSFSSLV